MTGSGLVAITHGPFVGDRWGARVRALATAVVLPEPAVEVPDAQVEERFDSGYGIFSHPTASRQWARLKFSPYRARWAAAEQWHPEQRITWAPDGSLLAGQTNRGWNSAGTRSYGLERVRWNGTVPFEIRAMRAQPDGFTLEFTRAPDPATATDPASYTGSSYTYLYQQKYGSPETDTQPLTVTRATVLADGKSVRLVCTGLRERYVHELAANGVRAAGGEALVNATGYYTLNRIPGR